MSALMAPLLSDEKLKRCVQQFARGASTEISTHDEANLPALAGELPPGSTVYVAHPPRATLEQVVRVAVRLPALGLRASPHIVARRLPNERALRTALRQLRDGGVEQVMLVAGDLADPLGDFTSTLEVLDSGCLEQAGILRAGVCGHPEGHPAVDTAALWQALIRKQAHAHRSGLQLHIVTQFGFDPKAICIWARNLAERGICLPVHVGIAGPTPLPKLIKFAMQCGVGASLRSMTKNLSAMRKMALTASPDAMLVDLVRSCAGDRATHLQQPHFFSFGGVIATAQWLRRVIEGDFELPSDGGKLQLQA